MSRLRREGKDLIGDLFVEPDLGHLHAVERGIGEERLKAQEHASLGVHRQVLVRVRPTPLRVILLPAALPCCSQPQCTGRSLTSRKANSSSPVKGHVFRVLPP